MRPKLFKVFGIYYVITRLQNTVLTFNNIIYIPQFFYFILLHILQVFYKSMLLHIIY